MKIDHLIVNINSKYQNEDKFIEQIKEARLEYIPKYGKGTKGFKVSNIWIGKEYFELVNVLDNEGGGWIKDWTSLYNDGHRGLVCLMIDVDDIDTLCNKLRNCSIDISDPKWLEFKWFFNLFTRQMPWRNSYIPFFEKVPLQIGFQQMKDDKSRAFMTKYMQPNSDINGVDGIKNINVFGDFTNSDFEMLQNVFENRYNIFEDKIEIHLVNNQVVNFIKNDIYRVEVRTVSNFGLTTQIENISITT